MSDEQDGAEQVDEDVILGDDQLYDEAEEENFPPNHLSGVPFADADVTDESLADRLRQMEPEPEPDLGDEERPRDEDAGDGA